MENQPVNKELEFLYGEREKLALVRDILSLKAEIQDLKNLLKTNGDTDSEEGESRESV